MNADHAWAEFRRRRAALRVCVVAWLGVVLALVLVPPDGVAFRIWQIAAVLGFLVFGAVLWWRAWLSCPSCGRLFYVPERQWRLSSFRRQTRGECVHCGVHLFAQVTAPTGRGAV